jgi:hypothetical protein
LTIQSTTNQHDSRSSPVIVEHNRQRQYDNELEQASTSIKQRIHQNESIAIRARFEHVLYQWLLESRQLYGQFPVYPSKEKHGSTVLFKHMSTMELDDFVRQVVNDSSILFFIYN